MFLLFPGSRVNWLIQPFFMISSLPVLLWSGKQCAILVPPNWYGMLAYASFTMYLLHRIIYHVLLKLYTPFTDVAVVCYLIVVGVPLLFLVSYFVQKQYDLLLTKFERGRVS